MTHPTFLGSIRSGNGLFSLAVNAIFLCSLLGAAYAAAPYVFSLVDITIHRYDADFVAEYRLAGIPPGDYEQEISRALAEDDPQLATSILTLANSRGVSISTELQNRVSAAEKFNITHAAKQMFDGALSGKANSIPGFAGSALADYLIVGDVRDLHDELSKPGGFDKVAALFALVDLGMTIAPAAKWEISFLKSARKMGKFSDRLAEQFARLFDKSIDKPALDRLILAAKETDAKSVFKEAERLIRPAELEALFDGAKSIKAIGLKQGVNGALQSLEIADSTEQLAKLGRLSEKTGVGYRGIVKMATRGGSRLIIRLAEIIWEAVAWIAAIIGWIIAGIFNLAKMISLMVQFQRRIRKFS